VISIFLKEESRINSVCEEDLDCMNVGYIAAWNGVLTGKCIKSVDNPNKKFCEIFSWCPKEDDNVHK
jgi:hypothetical protein